ncbi:MAG: transcriptional regulator with XRE-family HTH domain [Phenylobacterium sp.]|jgi:transcriptional regulator with XRE-family HTH domain
MYAMDLSDISGQIKDLRKQKGWSQKQLAEYAGLDRTTIGALERNDYSDIGIRKVQRVLLLLGQGLTVARVGMPTLRDLQAERNMEKSHG